MAKDPAFLFYTNEFSTGTQFFTDTQLGIFMRLLMAQHQHGHLSEKQVLIISKTYDNEVMKKFKTDEDGMFYNERLETEILKRKSYTESRSKNREGKINSKPSKKKKKSKSYDPHMGNGDEDRNIDEKYKGHGFSLSFIQVLDKWFKYRDEIKKPYKSELAVEEFLKKAQEMGEDEFIKQSTYSMSNQYQGLIKDKDDKKTGVYHQPEDKNYDEKL